MNDRRRPARVELHIDELVLHGFAPGDHHRVGESLRHELARLLGAPGTQAPPAGSRAEAAGREAARAVHGRIADALAPPAAPAKR